MRYTLFYYGILYTLLRGFGANPIDSDSLQPGRANSDGDTDIPGHYIILVKPHADIETVNEWIQPMIDNCTSSWLHHTFHMPNDDPGKSFKGYSGKFSEQILDKLRKHPDIIAIEPDRQVSIQSLQMNPPWNLARIAQHDHPLLDEYQYPDTAGADVDVYVIDTGIKIDHEEFDNGRATHGPDFTGEGDDDLNGHGTHIAGTIGGRIVGVAKKANLISVKTLDITGTGKWSNVIAGINWVVRRVVDGRRKSILNISIGGRKVLAVNQAVETAIAAGIHVTVAAGNNGNDACSYSPSSANGAISVGAIGYDDEQKTWSNYGPCVTLFAPGEAIMSASILSTTELISLAGTSMASPHVAGMIALALHRSKYSPMTMKNLLFNHTTVDRIKNVVGDNTPNRLLYIWKPRYRIQGESGEVLDTDGHW